MHDTVAFLKLKRALRLATLETRLATMRLALEALSRRYDPNQPRVPAGGPDGGQWTDGGGSGNGLRRNPSFRQQLAQGLRDSYGGDAGASHVQPAFDGFNNGPVTGLSRQQVDDSKWVEVRRVDEENDSITLEAGDTILVQPSQLGGTVTGSDAGTPGSPEGSHPLGLPPQFYYTISATPLDNSGKPQASIAPARWFGPREYSGGIGGTFTQIISANPRGGRVRWTIKLPPQADTGAVYPTVKIYVPRRN